VCEGFREGGRDGQGAGPFFSQTRLLQSGSPSADEKDPLERNRGVGAAASGKSRYLRTAGTFGIHTEGPATVPEIASKSNTKKREETKLKTNSHVHPTGTSAKA